MSSNEKNIPKRRFKEFLEGEAWEERKLEDVVDVFSGRDYKHLSEGSIPVYGTGGYMLSVNEALSYDKDAIGIGRKGTIDKPYVLKAPFWTVDTLFYAIPKEQYNLDFVFNIFQLINWKGKDESTGVPSLSKTAINDVDIFIPKSLEQEKIGAHFHKIDNLITLHQRKLDKLKVLKKAYLAQMFPSVGESKPRLRFSGFNDDWEQRKLCEIADRFDNLRVPVAADLRKEGLTPYYGANGIQDYVEGFTHDGEFILVAEDGANDLKNYPVNYVNGRIWVNNHAHVLQGKDKITDTRFLGYSINRANIASLLVGGGRAKLNSDIMMNIQLQLPSVEEQKLISEYFSSIDNLITLHQRKLEKLQNIKKAYLNEMFV